MSVHPRGELSLDRLWATINKISATPRDITLSQLSAFVGVASRMKDDILLTQPATVPETEAPSHLPPSVLNFLASCCELSPADVTNIWGVVKDAVWHGPSIESAHRSIKAAFIKHGHHQGLYFHSLYPPRHTCVMPLCPRTKKQMLMKKVQARQVVIYTRDEGPVPAYSVHLYCEGCHVNYHHDYRVENGQRVYYETIPDVLQVGEHQFVERRLIDMWINLMLVAWTSATNCARLYHLSFPDNELPQDWAFGLTLTGDHIWDAFTILTLLEGFACRQETLTVPHTGTQKEQFLTAVRARNMRFRLYGQPELRHHCHKCLRLYTDGASKVSRKVWVVIIDGVTIGHPCCAIHNCFTPLANNRHRFCPEHAPMHDVICAIVGCDRPVKADSLVCADLEHQERERVHRERGQARFQLKERLERAQLSHPTDALPDEHNLPDLDETDGTKSANARGKLRAQFGCKRTHNEQLIVAPCGVIIARETFYGAEGIGSVVEMIKRVFRGDIKPDHIFYDNNCHLAKTVKDDPFFQGIGLSVDVFHFKSKHSETDLFCQSHCNPAAFPELASEDDRGWFFNSSVAEQTNAWLGGYHSICREMLVDRYNYFLDEIIMRRNVMTCAKLQREGRHPELWPSM